MKKVLLFGILCTILCSCDILRQIPAAIKQIDYILTEDRMDEKTKITYCYGKKTPFVLEDETIYIPCKIDDTTHLLLYDSGFSEELTKLFPGNVKLPKTRRTMKQTIGTASCYTVIKQGLKFYNIKSDVFNFTNLVGYVVSVSSDTVPVKCMDFSDKIHGFILGLYSFPNRENAMFLHFSDTTITLLDSTDMYDTTGFMSVKSRQESNRIYICLNIDSIEYDFLFDTGSNGFLSIPRHKKTKEYTKTMCTTYVDPQYEKHKKENDISIVGFNAIDASGRVFDTITIQQTNAITMGDLASIKGSIDYGTSLLKPIMGMKFISNFDWIIDRYRKKIYAKQIKEIEYKEISTYYNVDVFDTTLQISLLPVGETKYQLFSIIDSVNGEKVNANNICQMRKLLNKKNGFTDNEIVILPPKETNSLKK